MVQTDQKNPCIGWMKSSVELKGGNLFNYQTCY